MNLTNHFLVAMPTMQDPQFKQSVIYLCEHNNEGAMGIIINQPIDISIADMLEQIEISRSCWKYEGVCMSMLTMQKCAQVCRSI